MGLDVLKKVSQTFTAQPKPLPKPPPASEGLPSNRVDGMTFYDGEDAANRDIDGITPERRAGIEVEVAFLDLKEKQRKQVSFDQWRAAQDRAAYEAYVRDQREP